jgi:signal peptidase I
MKKSFLKKGSFMKRGKKFILLLPPLLMIREIFGISVIKGRSMSPTLNPNTGKEGDIVLVLKTNDIQNNDIVFFKHPSNTDLSLVKRVKGLDNEFCNFRGKFVSIPTGYFWAQSDEP